MLTNFHVSIIKFIIDNVENNSNNMKQNMSMHHFDWAKSSHFFKVRTEKKRFMEGRLDSNISFTILPKTKRNILVNN